jgi:IS1 family transposase/transposase-like protein
VEWETLYCPNPSCQQYGVGYQESCLVKNGSSHGYQQFKCTACGRSVSVRYGTAYLDLEADSSLFDLAFRALAEGNSIRGTARIVEIDSETCRDWLERYAQQCRWVMLYFWQNLHIEECQLDELWSFVHTKEGNLAAAKLICQSDGDAWVWVAFAPLWRMVVAFVVGKRTQDNANLLLARVQHVSDGSIPFFTSDQLAAYPTALLQTYGEWIQPERKGSRGKHPHPRRVIPATLCYAQVVKQRENGRVVEVGYRVVYGQVQEIEKYLKRSSASQMINTSLVERENLTLRQSNRRLTRKTNGFSKEISGLEKQLWVSLAYYHFVLPHHSLRIPLSDPIPTRGEGSQKQWQAVTPAMAAGLTDHIWGTSELLSYRVPTECLSTIHQLETLFPLWESTSHTHH